MPKKTSKNRSPFKYAVLLGKDRRCLTLFEGKNSITLEMSVADAQRLGKLLTTGQYQ
jgi:hypothetical protein